MALLQTDPVDLKCDPNTGDLIITAGDAGFSNGLDGLAQAIRIAVLAVRGEWFLNLDNGIPYYARNGVPAVQALMGQPFNAAKTCATFRETIGNVVGVGSIDSVTATYVSKTRTMTVSWAVTSVFGGTVVDSLARGI
jgi:hypothetical protein